MVATKLRDIHVPLRPRACNATEGVQETLLHPIAKDKYVFSPPNLPTETNLEQRC